MYRALHAHSPLNNWDGPGPCGLHVALLASDGVQEYSCGFHQLVPGPLKLHCALELASVHAFGMELAIVWAFDAQENGFGLQFTPPSNGKPYTSSVDPRWRTVG